MTLDDIIDERHYKIYDIFEMSNIVLAIIIRRNPVIKLDIDIKYIIENLPVSPELFSQRYYTHNLNDCFSNFLTIISSLI